MKMSDVFALPSTYASVEYDCYAAEESCRYASHAINQHDALICALADILAAAESEGLEFIGYKEEIKQARDTLDRGK